MPFKWKIIAQNYQGDSIESDLIRILAAEVPDSPLAPEKVAADKTFITIRWLAPEFDGGVFIENYSVYVKEQGGSFILKQVLTDLSDLVYTENVPSVNIGQTYQFRISATNEVGESIRSDAASIIAGTVPSAAINLVKVSADVGQITFSWSPPVDDGGTPLTDYLVYWDEGQGSVLTLLKDTIGGPYT
jgi:hypothetical protein